MALIAELCSLPATDLTPPLDGSPESRKEKTFEALLGLMERFSRQRPVLMIFEDLHWIDPSSRELLDRIIGELGHWPVLMLATFRPEFQPVWVGQPNVTTLTLGRLDRRSTEALIENVACNRLLPTEIVQEIARRTEGVPLFAEELTKAVLESDTGGLAALPTVPRPALTVPVTLHASLMARLDRLGAAAKDVAQKGAVIGREFTYGLLASIADLPQEQLREALDDLADSGLLFTSGTPPQSRYMFKHALVQDTAYGMLLRARRQALHLRVGAALGTHSAVTESNPELLAHHFTLAECADQALPHWLRAGQIAAMRSANMEAIAHLRRGIDVLERLPASVDRDRQELAFQTALGPVLVATKGYSATETVNAYRRAWGLIESTKEGFFARLRSLHYHPHIRDGVALWPTIQLCGMFHVRRHVRGAIAQSQGSTAGRNPRVGVANTNPIRGRSPA